jgi:hypothetical protein
MWCAAAGFWPPFPAGGQLIHQAARRRSLLGKHMAANKTPGDLRAAGSFFACCQTLAPSAPRPRAPTTGLPLDCPPTPQPADLILATAVSLVREHGLLDAKAMVMESAEVRGLPRDVQAGTAAGAHGRKRPAAAAPTCVGPFGAYRGQGPALVAEPLLSPAPLAS